MISGPTPPWSGSGWPVSHSPAHRHRARHEQVPTWAGTVARRSEWISPSGHGVRCAAPAWCRCPAARWRPSGDGRAAGRGVEIPGPRRPARNERVPERGDDPRAASVVTDPLVAEYQQVAGHDGVLVHRTERSGQRVAVAVAHETDGPDGFADEVDCGPDRLRHSVSGTLRPGDRLTLTRFAAYECTPVDGASPEDLAGQVVTEAEAARSDGFDALLAAQRTALDAAWETADVVLDGDDELQQAIRFAMFHLIQAGRADGDRTIPAKGLTGNGYDGHVLWDTEGYVLPVLTYVAPELARSALRWRHAHLPQARDRAAELRLPGATFPWRTIGGQECSGYWPAGTAGLHVNADIADAVLRYAAVTGDDDSSPGGPGAAGGDRPALARLRPLVRHRHVPPVRGHGPDEYAARSTTTSSPT